MTMPRRIHLVSTDDFQLPAGAFDVATTSSVANPYRVVEHCAGGDWGVIDTGRFDTPIAHGFTRAGAATLAVRLYRQILDEAYPPASTARALLALMLAGKDLACRCPLDHECHGDVLLEVAAAAPQPETPRAGWLLAEIASAASDYDELPTQDRPALRPPANRPVNP